MFLRVFIQSFIILFMTIYLLFLPLHAMFKFIAIICSVIFLRELFFNKIIVDPVEGIVIFNRYHFYLNSADVKLIKFGLSAFIMVRLGYKKRHILCYFGDVESDYDLIRKYQKIIHPEVLGIGEPEETLSSKSK